MLVVCYGVVTLIFVERDLDEPRVHEQITARLLSAVILPGVLNFLGILEVAFWLSGQQRTEGIRNIFHQTLMVRQTKKYENKSELRSSEYSEI